MIYHLFQYLERCGVDIPGMGLMHYLSFRLRDDDHEY